MFPESEMYCALVKLCILYPSLPSCNSPQNVVSTGHEMVILEGVT